MTTDLTTRGLFVGAASDHETGGLERLLRERMAALGPTARAELLHILRLPDFGRAERIGEY